MCGAGSAHDTMYVSTDRTGFEPVAYTSFKKFRSKYILEYIENIPRKIPSSHK